MLGGTLETGFASWVSFRSAEKGYSARSFLPQNALSQLGQLITSASRTQLWLASECDVGVGVFPECEETPATQYGGMMTPVCAGSAVPRSQSPCCYGRLMGYV